MAVTGKLVKGGMTGLAVGAAVVVLGPILLPALTRLARPTARTALKAGLVLYDRGRETVARLAELAEDTLAEVRVELAEEADTAMAAAATTAPPPAGETKTTEADNAAAPAARVAEIRQPA